MSVTGFFSVLLVVSLLNVVWSMSCRFSCVQRGQCLEVYMFSVFTARIQIGPVAPTKTCSSSEVCCKKVKLVQQQCGKPGSFHLDVSRRDALAGNFPWQGALFRLNDLNRLEYLGGVSLIGSRSALTAAHKIYGVNPGRLVIRFGSVKLWNFEQSEQVQVGVEYIRFPSNFNMASLTNNIAMLLLTSPVPFSTNIAPICIPESPDPWGQLDVTNCFVAGWGKDAFRGEYQEKLRYIKLPLVLASQCEDAIRRHTDYRNFQLPVSQLCAGGQRGEDACSGDGGSPLVCPDIRKFTYFQVGIVSYGIECGKPNVPAVYTDVVHFSDWIREQVGRGGLSIGR